MMSTAYRPTTPDDVADKVLRRAEVARMARLLHDRLALASYKAIHGQENMSFKDVEIRLEHKIKRKRLTSRLETASTCSSSSSEHLYQTTTGFASSPPTMPFYSDDIDRSDRVYANPRKRATYHAYPDMAGLSGKRVRSYSMAPPHIEQARSTWKSSHNLPQSSPLHARQGSRFSASHGQEISFTSEVSTIPDSPPFTSASDEEAEHRPHHSFNQGAPGVRLSSPRTPPPTHHRKRSVGNGEEGADLLLYLATSPSPANPHNKSTRLFAPSTPPSRDIASISAAMTTPGLNGFNTPGQPFNFADFVNVTPSPAQGAFGNLTPGPTKTPIATRDVRKRLNFDALVPPNGSPTLSNIGRGIGKGSGTSMELGGELIS